MSFVKFYGREQYYGELSRVVYLFGGRFALSFSRLRFRVILERLP